MKYRPNSPLVGADERGSPALPIRTRPAGLLEHGVGLINALHCGAMIVDRRGRIVHANPRLCEMLGRDCAQVIGVEVRTLYASEKGRSFVEERLAQFDRPHEGEFYLPQPDGSLRPVIVSGRAMQEGAAPTDYRLVTLIDISRQKKVEARASEMYHEIAKLSDVVLEQALSLKEHSRELENKIRVRTAELHEANLQAVYMLAVASETKDEDTGAHIRRIQQYTQLFARALGLPGNTVEQFGQSAILHDVGKMSVPDRILKKPGPLSPDERRQMQRHTLVGERILSTKPFFDLARKVARSHHENWDGSGYPDGLSGWGIPLSARIVRLVDVFDALLSERSYKRSWRPAEAAAFIQQGSSRLFDPQLVSVFKSLFNAGELQHVWCPSRPGDPSARLAC